MLQTKVVEKIKTHILFNIFFFLRKLRSLYMGQCGKFTVAFKLQQWLRERVTISCYTYIAYLVVT